MKSHFSLLRNIFHHQNYFLPKKIIFWYLKLFLRTKNYFLKEKYFLSKQKKSFVNKTRKAR